MKETSMSKICLVTGASRGLGLEITRALLAAGHTVVATARSTKEWADKLGGGDRLHTATLDVTDPDGAKRAVQEAIDRFGRIDVLVNNAGMAQLGWFETINDEHVRQEFDVNLFGAMNLARAVLPGMRERRSGLIVTISSVNGIVANPGGSIYSASKFAIEGWVEGLAQEIEPLGVRSLLIEPGMLRTEFLDPVSAQHGDIEIGDYAKAVSQFRSFIADANGNQPNDPAKLAAHIADFVVSPSPPARFVYGEDALGWATEKINRLREEIERSRDMQVDRARSSAEPLGTRKHS